MKIYLPNNTQITVDTERVPVVEHEPKPKPVYHVPHPQALNAWTAYLDGQLLCTADPQLSQEGAEKVIRWQHGIWDNRHLVILDHRH